MSEKTAIQQTNNSQLHNPLYGLSKQQILEKLKINGMWLQFVPNKTQEMCEVAVEQNSNALQFIESVDVLIAIHKNIQLNIPINIEENVSGLIKYLEDNKEKITNTIVFNTNWSYDRLDIKKIFYIALKNNPHARLLLHPNIKHLIECPNDFQKPQPQQEYIWFNP